MMAEIQAVAKKWGSSIGVVIPKEIIEKNKIKENDKIIIEVKKTNKASAIWGLIKAPRIDAQKAKNEMRRGWD